MVSAIALVSGVSAVFVGSLRLRTWLRYGGASGTSHFRRVQILGHAAVGIAGVVLVVVHLVASRDSRWGWTAVGVLLTAGLLGATMFSDIVIVPDPGLINQVLQSIRSRTRATRRTQISGLIHRCLPWAPRIRPNHSSRGRRSITHQSSVPAAGWSSPGLARKSVA
jgi:hypothetical protein